MIEAGFLGGRGLRLAGAVCIAATLAACAEGPDFSFLQPKGEADKAEVSRAATTPVTKLAEQDVEAPDVFNAKEAGLWDGRPSLGGVWVAHPDVTEPERVMIRNSANGKSVVGALFRRERDVPGPRLQASSDAAVSLGMLAGAPVELKVVALRREEIQPEPTPETVAEAVPEAAEVEEATLDPIAATAAAAIDASDPAQEPALTGGEEVQTASLDTGTATSVAETPARPARKSWFGARLFDGLKKKDRDVGAPLSALKPLPDAEAEDVQVVAATPEVATAALAKPEAQPKPRTALLRKPYVQIGIFSIQSNADKTADQMRVAGMVPTVYEQSSGGKMFWRVVVGPARNIVERQALLKKIRAEGFADAYAVTN